MTASRDFAVVLLSSKRQHVFITLLATTGNWHCRSQGKRGLAMNLCQRAYVSAKGHCKAMCTNAKRLALQHGGKLACKWTRCWTTEQTIITIMLSLMSSEQCFMGTMSLCCVNVVNACSGHNEDAWQMHAHLPPHVLLPNAKSSVEVGVEEVLVLVICVCDIRIYTSIYAIYVYILLFYTYLFFKYTHFANPRKVPT